MIAIALIPGVEENQWYALMSPERTEGNGEEEGSIVISFRVPLVCQTVKQRAHAVLEKPSNYA